MDHLQCVNFLGSDPLESRVGGVHHRRHLTTITKHWNKRGRRVIILCLCLRRKKGNYPFQFRRVSSYLLKNFL